MNKQQAAFVAVAEKVAATYRDDKYNTRLLDILSTMYEESLSDRGNFGAQARNKIKDLIKSCSVGYYEGYFNKPKSTRVASALGKGL